MKNLYKSFLALTVAMLPAVAFANTMSTYTLDPADGAEVPELSQIKLVFPGTSEGIDAYGSTKDIVVKNAAGDVVSTCAGVDYADNNTAPNIIRLDNTVTAAGTYTLLIPANTFKDYVLGGPDDVNNEITATYVIPGKEVNLMEIYGISPAASSRQRGLSFFSVKFEYVEAVELAGDPADVALLDEEGEPVAFGMFATVAFDNSVKVVLDATVAEPGKYTLNIPAGFAAEKDGTGLSPEINETFEVVYAGEYENTMTEYMLDPEDEATVEELETISILFPRPADGIELAVSVSNIGTYAVLVGEDNVYPAKAIKAAGDSYEMAEITFDKITEKGTYRLWISPEIVYDYELAESSETGDGFVGNPEIRATYTVGGTPVSTETMNNWVLTPAENTEVESLARITVTFPDTADGIELCDGVIAADAAVLTCGEVVIPASFVALTSDCTGGMFVFDGVAENGEYTLTIAPGVFRDYTNPEAVNPEIKAVYKLKIKEVEGIVSAEVVGDSASEVYDLQGRRLRATDGVRSLAPGLYIVNGKKVSVK